jgi:hypothetical protein
MCRGYVLAATPRGLVEFAIQTPQFSGGYSNEDSSLLKFEGACPLMTCFDCFVEACSEDQNLTSEDQCRTTPAGFLRIKKKKVLGKVLKKGGEKITVEVSNRSLICAKPKNATTDPQSGLLHTILPS